MNAIDEYDIRDTFQALDSDQDGVLTLDEFHTLYLGLGYRPQRITPQELQQLATECIKDDADRQGGIISLEVVLEVLKKFVRNDRNEQMEEMFQFFDSDGKGYISAADLQRLGQELGQELSEGQAKRIAAFYSGKEADGAIDKATFWTLLSPPEP